MIKIVIGILFSVSVLFSSTWIVIEDANLREKPSLEASVVTTYFKDTKVNVLDIVHTKEDGRWYRLENGYISTELVKPFRIDEKDSYKIDKEEQSYIIIEDKIDIYEKADKESSLKNTISSSKIKILCEMDKKDIYPWYKVEGGFVSSAYVLGARYLKPCIPLKEKEKEKVKAKIKNKKVASIKVEPKQKVVKPKKKIKIEKNESIYKKDFFIGALIGINSFSVNKEDSSGSITLANELDDKGYSFNIHLGTKLYDNYRLIANYEYIPLDDVTFNNYYLSLNYQWDRYLNPYFGASVGLSSLSWEIDPLTNSTSKDENSQAGGFLGLQGGIEYQYDKRYSFISQVSYQEFFHKTNLSQSGSTSSIKHDRLFQFGVGLRYSF